MDESGCSEAGWMVAVAAVPQLKRRCWCLRVWTISLSSAFPQKSCKPSGVPLQASQAKKANREVGCIPLSAQQQTDPAAVDPALLPIHQSVPCHGTVRSPCLIGGAFLALHSSEMWYFLFFSSFFLLASCAGLGPGSFEELQHMNISQGRGVRVERQRSPPWSYLERRGKENGTWVLNQEKGGETVQLMWIIF